MENKLPKFRGKKKHSALRNILTWIQGKKSYSEKSGELLEQLEEEQQRVSSEDGSNGLESAGEQDRQNSSEILNVVQYDMFNIVTSDKGTFIALGNNRVSEMLSGEIECKSVIDDKDWKLIFNVIAVTANAIIRQKESEKETPN